MCKAPKIPAPPAPVTPPQAAQNPIGLPDRRKRATGVSGTAGFSADNQAPTLLGNRPAIGPQP